MPVAPPTNWRRWTEKENGGVNGGHSQAYINTSRFTNRVLLSEARDFLDYAAKVTVQSGRDNGGVFNRKAEKDVENFDSISAAEEYAREQMAGMPVSRDGDKRTAVEVLTDVHEALGDQGLVAQHDADKTGWTKAMGSTGFSLKPYIGTPEENEGADDPRDADLLLVHLSVDGKESGLSYSEDKEVRDDGEVIRVHHPRRPEQLTTDVEAALTAAGFDTVHSVRNSGHQTHWDYTTHYSAFVGVPEDLTRPKPSRGRSRRRF